MNRIKASLAALLLWPGLAQADVFARLTGTFGDPTVPEESCAANPAFSTFSADHQRLTVTWAKPVPSYTGAMITVFQGSVIKVHPASITILRDHETRLAHDGSQVEWIMRPTTDPIGLCWTRSDWIPHTCLQLERCKAAPNS